MRAGRKMKQKVGYINPQAAGKQIGSRLRQFRKEKRLTLVDLAKAAGVDIATISRIETGRMTGTLESHVKLANALGVKVTELYSGLEDVRARQGATHQLPSARNDVYVHEAGAASIALLTSDVLKKKLMPVLITIEPGGSTQQEEARLGTEQFLYVLEGVADAVVGEETFALKKGSSLYFDASIPHQIRNTGQAALRCISVTTPPAL